MNGAVAAVLVGGCVASRATGPEREITAARSDPLQQSADALLADQTVAVAYSGFRRGQHPDRGGGAVYPSRAELTEDLRLLSRGGTFGLIRLYDAGELSREVLDIIVSEGLPVKVVLGAWLSAEISNHESCAWLTEPIPSDELVANTARNDAEVGRAIALATAYRDIVVAVNVGNEALVTWNDHRVSVERVVALMRRVKAETGLPVTTADNYVPWVDHAALLGPAADFAFVHTYPVWEGRDVDEGLPYTVENLMAVRAALPDEPIAIGEAGWPSVASEFGPRASERAQARYVGELSAWARAHAVTTFVFEAFDEPWKGDPDDPLGAEKHWGLFDVDRQPKAVVGEVFPRLLAGGPARHP